MRTLSVFLALAVAAAGSGCSRPQTPTVMPANRPSAVPSIPQAAPMVDLLTALKESDQEKFRSVNAGNIRSGQQPWNEKLAEAKGSVTRMFGDYNIADFQFSFDGDEQSGVLATTLRQKPPLRMRVVKEMGEWKLAEH